MVKAALFVAALCVVAAPAHAETKAWTAAKAGLPAETKIVLGIDVAAIQKTELFATAFPKLIAKLDPSGALAKLKSTCKMDPLTTIQSVVLATDADKKVGAIYVGVVGLDQGKLAACLKASAPAADAGKVSVTRTGDVTAISIGPDTYYFGWIGTDVLVVPAKSVDKAMLEKWTSGKGALAKTEVGRTLAKVNTGAALWGAGNVAAEIVPGTTMKAGYGSVGFAKGKLDADVHGVMNTAAAATQMADKTNAQLAEVQKGGLPDSFAAVLGAVKVSAQKDEVVIRASVIEKDLAALMALALTQL